MLRKNSQEQNHLSTRMSSDRFGGLPKKGDLIEASCGLFEHWAVYVGDGYVIHLTKIDSSGSMSGPGARAVVKKDALPEQDEGYKYRINNKYDKKMEPLCDDEIVLRAELMVGKEIPYSLTNYNCEHFVTELRYGVPMCDQVKDKGLFATLALAVATLFTLVFHGSQMPSSH